MLSQCYTFCKPVTLFVPCLALATQCNVIIVGAIQPYLIVPKTSTSHYAHRTRAVSTLLFFLFFFLLAFSTIGH
ncbi:hypothetical protein BDR03DRAFT_975560 [Suillus americanus]|nr:hypothetical protein BDR03DRAFT_975560 [Suillus americanus]